MYNHRVGFFESDCAAWLLNQCLISGAWQAMDSQGVTVIFSLACSTTCPLRILQVLRSSI